MSLLDAIEPDAGEREELEPVLRRRTAYLEARAVDVSERAPAAMEPWRHRMAAATLWLEAAESAACLAEYDDARRYLRQGCALLLQLNLPFGVALHGALLPDDDELASLADQTNARWQRADAREQRDSAEDARDDSPDLIGAVPRARESAQQWAYLSLINSAPLPATPTRERELLSERFSSQTPVGRMLQPLNTYQFLGAFAAVVVASPADVTDQVYGDVMSVLGKNIASVHRSVQFARANRHLWKRMLAPAPLFDLDTAVLTGVVIGVTRENNPELADRAASFGVAQDDRFYAMEFVRAVRALRSAGQQRGGRFNSV